MSFPIGVFTFDPQAPPSPKTPSTTISSRRSFKRSGSDLASHGQLDSPLVKSRSPKESASARRRRKDLYAKTFRNRHRADPVSAGTPPNTTAGDRRSSCQAGTPDQAHEPSPCSPPSAGGTRSKHIPILVPGYAALSPVPAARSASLSTWTTGDSPPPPTTPIPLLPSQQSLPSPGSDRPKHVEIKIPAWAHPVVKQPGTPPRVKLSHSTFLDPFTELYQTTLQDMSRQTSELARGAAQAPQQPANTVYNHVPNGDRNDMVSASSSQSSLLGQRDGYGSASEAESTHEDVDGAQAATTSSDQGTPGQAPAHTSPNANASNLSGLVCNVHRTTGKQPPPLVGATTTVLGDNLFVLGGRKLSRSRPQLTSNLYQLDLIKRHWTKVEVKGDIPPPRYFHSVCALGDKKLVCYGGMSPSPQPSDGGPEAQAEVMVMSDIYIFDVPTRMWTKIYCQEQPQGRYAHCATILPSSAVFASHTAPMSALHHNPSGSNPNSGTLGVALDGTGGAEMVVVGGQDRANNYIEQVSVFNLRSLKWTGTTGMGRSCGAYRSVVATLTSMTASQIGAGLQARPEPEEEDDDDQATIGSGAPMLIYSNYNFLDVKLELQVRLNDGTLTERSMHSEVTPPGLRFPNGAVIANHFIVSGTFLTSSKQEYCLWALDLRTLTWSRIDAGGSIFGHGSWNRGVLWARRNTFVILGNRKRSLVDDYNNRRTNFANICLVELEAFGLYDNPRRSEPASDYTSMSASATRGAVDTTAAGRKLLQAAEGFGALAMNARELTDMEFLAIDGSRIPVNSRLISRRWGPHFNELMREAVAAGSDADAATLRARKANQSRMSSITITPSVSSGAATLTSATNAETLDTRSGPAHVRPRLFYLPHTPATLQALLHYLYTSSLASPPSPLATPQVFCSLLQLARPYQIDGLLEAVVERLHGTLDGRNAAAIFNAAAMAAGGGDALLRSPAPSTAASTLHPHPRESIIPLRAASLGRTLDAATPSLNGAPLVRGPTNQLRIDTDAANARGPANGGNGVDVAADAARDAAAAVIVDDDRPPDSARTDTSVSDMESGFGGRGAAHREPWTGALSAVVGLQKRGLRGLMEGRRMRERGRSEADGRVGLGIA